MSKIWIGTSITENYIAKAIPFLKSLKTFHDNVFCVCYGFNPSVLQNRFKEIKFHFLPRNCVEIEGMIQWGTWLKAVPHSDDDIYIISDSDMAIQRRLHDKEIARFLEYDNNTVGVSVNMGHNDFLHWEAIAIGLKPGFPFNKDAPIYNCGVMVARPTFFKNLTDKMESLIPTFNKYSSHRSRCQFLICHIFDTYKINVDLISREFHTNGHGGIPAGCRFVNSGPDTFPGRNILFNNSLVMFRHHF